jgi:hypothetical protein
MRIALLILALLQAVPVFAQDPAAEQKRLDAERRELDAERRALEAERRAVEAERRNQASQGSSRPSSPSCQAAMASYQTACSRPNVDPLWETAQCVDARKLVSEQCR